MSLFKRGSSSLYLLIKRGRHELPAPANTQRDKSEADSVHSSCDIDSSLLQVVSIALCIQIGDRLTVVVHEGHEVRVLDGSGAGLFQTGHDGIINAQRSGHTALGVVALACALKMGAILADASDEDAENLYKFGEQIGLAFQLQDDYLDVYGDTKVFGKEIGGDITSNKKTYMLINAFNHANDAQRAELQKWVDAKDFDRKEKVAAVTRLYNEIGIDKMAQDKIAYYFEQSKKYLDAVNVPAERKEELAKYAQKMMKRQY